jgi:hypothetical protein
MIILYCLNWNYRIYDFPFPMKNRDETKGDFERKKLFLINSFTKSISTVVIQVVRVGSLWPGDGAAIQSPFRGLGWCCINSAALPALLL